MLTNKLHLIAFFSFVIKLFVVFLFHEDSLKDEWLIIFQNIKSFKSYSFYVFDGVPIPSSYMPPLYFVFLYINKILSFDYFNFLYLVFFNQILLSTLSVYIFYSICKNFFIAKTSLIGTIFFSIFPIMLYANGLVSSATIQLFLYLSFIKIFLDFIDKSNYSNFILLIILSSLNLLLRGEFLVIFLFSIIFLVFLNKKKLVKATLLVFFTLILISPYLSRNYLNTDKIHLVNVSGYALWKGNNQISGVEGFHNPLYPENRSLWPKITEFKNLYKKLDDLPKDKKYEINRDKVFQNEAIENITSNKKRYLVLYIKKILSYYFFDISSSIKNYYNPLHIFPILLMAALSIPGMIIAYKKFFNIKILYIFFITIILTALISLFFILPRYKISIISFQIIFSLYFIDYLINKVKKN